MSLSFIAIMSKTIDRRLLMTNLLSPVWVFSGLVAIVAVIMMALFLVGAYRVIQVNVIGNENNKEWECFVLKEGLSISASDLRTIMRNPRAYCTFKGSVDLKGQSIATGEAVNIGIEKYFVIGLDPDNHTVVIKNL